MGDIPVSRHMLLLLLHDAYWDIILGGKAVIGESGPAPTCHRVRGGGYAQRNVPQVQEEPWFCVGGAAVCSERGLQSGHPWVRKYG